MSSENLGITAFQLARYMAASAIHQIGRELEQQARGTKFYDSDSLMAILTARMEKVTNDIIEVCTTEPYMFFTMINMGVASAVIYIVQEWGEGSEVNLKKQPLGPASGCQLFNVERRSK